MIDFFFPDLSKRSNEPELMDDYHSDKKKLINTVKQFTILNFLFTRSRGLIKKYILPDMKKNKNYTFLDLGAGGCDIPIWLLKKCNKAGINVKITCIDNDKRITDYATKKCKTFSNIKIINASAFDIEKFDNFDYIFANHFLHHLPYNDISKLIDLIFKKTNRLFLLNDILRSNAAYLGYTLFTGLFIHFSFAFYDGRLSIKKGFTQEELKQIIDNSAHKKRLKIVKAKPARICILGNKI
jgi:2-polyprenyl-3-methyl-5-hydroxy-6-metoxy-1,4-benzoquinol methylase